MIAVFESVLPILPLILRGFGLRKANIFAADKWQAIEEVCFWIFFPGLLVTLIVAGVEKKTAQTVTDEVLSREDAKTLATKADLSKLKSELVMWMVRLLIAHSALIITVLR